MNRSMNTPTRGIAMSLGNALAFVLCAASEDCRQPFLVRTATRDNQGGS